MRTLHLVLLLVLLAGSSLRAQSSSAKVLRSVTTAPLTATSTRVTPNLVPQSATITVRLRYGLTDAYELGERSVVVSSISPTYSPPIDLTGLTHGLVYLVEVQATSAAGVTETKTTEFTQNLLPKARRDELKLTTFGANSVQVLRNDTDEDNAGDPAEGPVTDPLRIKRVIQPAHGNVVIVGKTLVYTPGASFLGADEFEYVITDPHGGTDRGTVSVTGVQFSLFGGHALMLQDRDGATAGYLRIDVSRGGSFTGSLRIGSKSYALLGSFDAAGKFLGFARSGEKLMAVALRISEDANGVKRLQATLANGEFTATEETSTQTIISLEELAGRYTIELPTSTIGDGDGTDTDDDENDDSEEFGTGWAIMEINRWGEVQIEGETGDRRSFSASALLSGSPDGPLVSFYATQKHGFLAGTLNLAETISGTLVWYNEGSGGDFYPDEFEMEISANGGRWEEPEDDNRAMATEDDDADRAQFSVSGGNTTEFERELEISESDSVRVLDRAEERLEMEIDRDDGRFVGKFRHLDDLDKRSKFRGVFLQGQGRGSGVFEGEKAAGRVEVTIGAAVDPDPEPPTPDPIDPTDPTDPDVLFPEPDTDLEFDFNF